MESITPISDEDKKEYLKPYLDQGESRRPTLGQNIPLDGTEPNETLSEVKENAKFHSNSEIPKLFINAIPGLILTGEQREEIRKWKNLSDQVKAQSFLSKTLLKKFQFVSGLLRFFIV